MSYLHDNLNDWYKDEEALKGEAEYEDVPDSDDEEEWQCPTCGRYTCMGYCPV